MKYKIEIWQYYSMVATYESDDIEDVLSWYKIHWWNCYEMGNCVFSIYENDIELDFDEEYKLGFHS